MTYVAKCNYLLQEKTVELTVKSNWATVADYKMTCRILFKRTVYRFLMLGNKYDHVIRKIR